MMLFFYFCFAILTNDIRPEKQFFGITHYNLDVTNQEILTIYEKRLENFFLDYLINYINDNTYKMVNIDIMCERKTMLYSHFKITAKLLFNDPIIEDKCFDVYNVTFITGTKKNKKIHKQLKNIIFDKAVYSDQKKLLSHHYTLLWTIYNIIKHTIPNDNICINAVAIYYAFIYKQMVSRYFVDIYKFTLVINETHVETIKEILDEQSTDKNIPTKYVTFTIDDSVFLTKHKLTKIVTKLNLYNTLTDKQCQTMLENWTFVHFTIKDDKNEQAYVQNNYKLMYKLKQLNNYICDGTLSSLKNTKAAFFCSKWSCQLEEENLQYALIDTCNNSIRDKMITDIIISTYVTVFGYANNYISEKNIDNCMYNFFYEIMSYMKKKLQIKDCESIFEDLYVSNKNKIEKYNQGFVRIFKKPERKLDVSFLPKLKEVVCDVFTKFLIKIREKNNDLTDEKIEFLWNYTGKYGSIFYYQYQTIPVGKLRNVNYKIKTEKFPFVTKYLIELIGEYRDANLRVDVYINFHDYLLNLINVRNTIHKQNTENNENAYENDCKKEIDRHIAENLECIEEFYRRKKENSIKMKINIKIYNDVDKSTNKTVQLMFKDVPNETSESTEEGHKWLNIYFAKLYAYFVNSYEILNHFLDNIDNTENLSYYAFELKKIENDSCYAKILEETQKIRENEMFKCLQSNKNKNEVRDAQENSTNQNLNQQNIKYLISPLLNSIMYQKTYEEERTNSANNLIELITIFDSKTQSTDYSQVLPHNDNTNDKTTLSVANPMYIRKNASICFFLYISNVSKEQKIKLFTYDKYLENDMIQNEINSTNIKLYEVYYLKRNVTIFDNKKTDKCTIILLFDRKNYTNKDDIADFIFVTKKSKFMFIMGEDNTYKYIHKKKHGEKIIKFHGFSIIDVIEQNVTKNIEYIDINQYKCSDELVTSLNIDTKTKNNDIIKDVQKHEETKQSCSKKIENKEFTVFFDKAIENLYLNYLRLNPNIKEIIKSMVYKVVNAFLKYENSELEQCWDDYTNYFVKKINVREIANKQMHKISENFAKCNMKYEDYTINEYLLIMMGEAIKEYMSTYIDQNNATVCQYDISSTLDGAKDESPEIKLFLRESVKRCNFINIADSEFIDHVAKLNKQKCQKDKSVKSNVAKNVINSVFKIVFDTEEAEEITSKKKLEDLTTKQLTKVIIFRIVLLHVEKSNDDATITQNKEARHHSNEQKKTRQKTEIKKCKKNVSKQQENQNKNHIENKDNKEEENVINNIVMLHGTLNIEQIINSIFSGSDEAYNSETYEIIEKIKTQAQVIANDPRIVKAVYNIPSWYTREHSTALGKYKKLKSNTKTNNNGLFDLNMFFADSSPEKYITKSIEANRIDADKHKATEATLQQMCQHLYKKVEKQLKTYILHTEKTKNKLRKICSDLIKVSATAMIKEQKKFIISEEERKREELAQNNEITVKNLKMDTASIINLHKKINEQLNLLNSETTKKLNEIKKKLIMCMICIDAVVKKEKVVFDPQCVFACQYMGFYNAVSNYFEKETNTTQKNIHYENNIIESMQQIIRNFKVISDMKKKHSKLVEES